MRKGESDISSPSKSYSGGCVSGGSSCLTTGYRRFRFRKGSLSILVAKKRLIEKNSEKKAVIYA
jgi:hypothetical protein